MSSDNVPTKFGSNGALTQGIASLTGQDRKKLSKQIAEAQVELESNARQAELRHQASSADMRRDMEIAKEATSSGNDFKVEGSYKTASGETRVTVSKQQNTVTIVVVVSVVIALIVLVAR
jgi:hypothetical protein